MYKELKEKVLVKEKWRHGLLLLVFFVIKYIVSMLINLIAIFQFFHDLLLDKPNDKLLDFSKRLNNYLLQIVNFLTFNSLAKPFPFSDWS